MTDDDVQILIFDEASRGRGRTDTAALLATRVDLAEETRSGEP